MAGWLDSYLAIQPSSQLILGRLRQTVHNRGAVPAWLHLAIEIAATIAKPAYAGWARRRRVAFGILRTGFVMGSCE